MKTDCDSQEKGGCFPKLSRCKYKIAFIILTPLFIVAFLSIVSLRATLYSQPEEFDVHRVLNKLINLFIRPEVKIKSASPVSEKSTLKYSINMHSNKIVQYQKSLINKILRPPELPGLPGPDLKSTWLNYPSNQVDSLTSILNNLLESRPSQKKPRIYITNDKKNPGQYIIKITDVYSQTEVKGFDANFFSYTKEK